MALTKALPPADPAPVAPRGLLSRRLRPYSPRVASARLITGVVLAVLLVGGTLGAMSIGHITPVQTDISARLLGMGQKGHLLGTDDLGRDLLKWTIAGFAWSASVSALGACMVAVIGILLGVAAGASSGALRATCSRIIDICLSLPYLVIAVAIMAAVGRGFWPLSITLGVVSWPIFARVIYAETRGLMQREYVRAGRLLGSSALRIIATHVVPGIRNTILVMWAFVFADLLVAESGLSFLGIGAPLGSPSLGNMLADGRQYLVQAPRMVVVPAVVIVLAVTAANLIGDGYAARTRSQTRTMVR